MTLLTAVLSTYILASALGKDSSGPIPVTLTANFPSVTLNVGSGPAEVFILDPLARHSMKRHGAGSEPSLPSSIAGGSSDLGTVKFSPMPLSYARSLPESVDGVLGQDFLDGKAIGFDNCDSTATFWLKSLSSPEAASWVGHYPEWKPQKGPRVISLPVSVTRGFYTMPVKLGDFNSSGMLSFRHYTSALDLKPGAKDICEVPGLESLSESIASEMQVSGYRVRWPFFSTEQDSNWDRSQVNATLDPLLFVKRRCIYDFANLKVYVEAFSEDGELSFFLSKILHAPFAVDAISLTLTPIPGVTGLAQVGALTGARVVEVAGMATDDLLKALRGNSKEDMRAVSRLFGLVNAGFEVRLRVDDGTIKTIRFSPPNSVR